MAVSKLKKHFGGLLKKYTKDAKKRQLDIAAALELSPSAVSQMYSGRMIPNLKQLDTIMQILALDRNCCSELRDCLARIRSGDAYLRSPLNDFIKSERTKKGLTIDQLAMMSGIPKENLEMLETHLNTQPTPHEAVRLAAIFNCSVSELWQVVPEQSASVNSLGSGKSGQVMVMRENPGNYRDDSEPHPVKIPQINYMDLLKFNSQYDTLLDFAWRHMAGVDDGNAIGLVQVKAPGREFGWSGAYDVKLEIAETKQWLEDMTVLGIVDGDLVLGRATGKKNEIIALADGEKLSCQWGWLVNSFCFCSDIFEKSSDNGNSRRFKNNSAIARVLKSEPDAIAADSQEEKNG